ncbi:MAG TPA: hypothetical protein ENK57_11260, partial [Polyangiaceae bacterium]|nr:hypothetical protein [Polyangiaceae bacterium]
MTLPQGAACAAHEEPASFVCDRCGDFGCVSCLFFAGGKRSICITCAEKGLGQPIPWERRSEIGNVQAFWQTTKLCMFSPTRFFCTPTTQEDSLSAIAYGVVAVTVGL